MSTDESSFSFTATTASGRIVELELPLHPETSSSAHVGALLEGILDAVSRLIDAMDGASDGDVLQALSLAMAVRLGVGTASPEAAERLLRDLVALAERGVASATEVSAPGRQH